MNKLLRIGFRVFLVLLVLFILATAGLYMYVSYHKEALLARISSQFHRHCYGTLQIGDMHPELLSGFPDATLSLKHVVIRDSLWEQHRQDLLQVADIDVSLRILPLLAGKVEINKLGFRNGSIYLFEDSNGYTNRHIFRPGKEKSGSRGIVIRKFQLEDIRFGYQHTANRKRFDLDIRQLWGKIDGDGPLKAIRTRADILVNQCIFNEQKGSFLKGKRLQCHLTFSYDKQKQLLDFPKQRIRIDEHNLMAGARFELQPGPGIFHLDITDDQLRFQDARTWLSPNISRHLDSFLLERPIKVQALIEGRMKGQPNPYVNIRCQVKDNILHTAKGGLLEHCSFNGSFRNGSSMYTLCGDEQSVISIEQAAAAWKQVPFRSDSFVVYNLKQPRLDCRIRSDFPVMLFNNITGGEVFRFDTGKAMIDVRYCGSLNPDDTITSHIFGSIQIKDAAFTYTPRNISFDRCRVLMKLEDQDISIPVAECRSKGSQLQLTAMARRFLALYRSQPEDILLTATATSNQLNLDEFRSFLGKRRQGLPPKTDKGKMAERLDKALEACTTDLRLHIRALRYHKFEARDIRAGILLLPDGIRLRQVSLSHAGGTVVLSGSADQRDDNNNRFRIDTRISNVAVDKLFTGFGNFGLQSLRAEHIRGICSLDGNISGGIDASGDLIPGSLKGSIHFVLERGQLLNFKPLERMGRFAFRRKRLSEVSFSRISNTLTIDGNNILIPPMQIASDLLDLNLQGIFSLEKGTDLQIDIPILSMSKDDINYNDESGGTGPRLHIRGKDDENGELQFSWRLKDKAKKIQQKKDRQERKARRRALLGRLPF